MCCNWMCFTWSLSLARTQLLGIWFTWNKKQYLSLPIPRKYIILLSRWHHWFIWKSDFTFSLHCGSATPLSTENDLCTALLHRIQKPLSEEYQVRMWACTGISQQRILGWAVCYRKWNTFLGRLSISFILFSFWIHVGLLALCLNYLRPAGCKNLFISYHKNIFKISCCVNFIYQMEGEPEIVFSWGTIGRILDGYW